MDVLANDIAKGRIFSALSLVVEVPTAKPDQCLSLIYIYQISLFATYHGRVQRGDNETWLVRL